MVLTHLSSRSDPPYMRDPVAVAVAVASRSPSSGRPRFVGGAEALLGDAEEVLVAMVITMMGDDMDAAVSTYYVGLVALANMRGWLSACTLLACACCYYCYGRYGNRAEASKQDQMRRR